MSVKGAKIPVTRGVNSENLMYSIVITVNNIVSYLKVAMFLPVSGDYVT